MPEENDGKKTAALKFPTLSVGPSPHIKSDETVRSLMLSVVIALLPAFIWGIFIFGLRALIVVLISVCSAVLSEFLFEKLLKRKVTVFDCSAIVTGLLLGLNLPVAVPLWLPAVGAAFAIIVVKQLFGGIGKNFLNPALAARVFLFSWTGEMTKFTAPFAKLPLFSSDIDAVASATPLKYLNAGELPTGTSLLDAIIGNTSGCIGEVSALLLFLGGIYLVARKVITLHIPLAFIGTVALLTYLFPLGDMDVSFPLYSIFSGAVFIGAFFMATDYSTSPLNPAGKIIYGCGCGALTVLIRYFGSYPEGVSFAILIMNLLVWFIDKLTAPRTFGKSKSKEKKSEAAK